MSQLNTKSDARVKQREMRKEMQDHHQYQDENDEESDNNYQNDFYHHNERRAYSHTSFKNGHNEQHPQKQDIPSYSKSKNDTGLFMDYARDDVTSGRGFGNKTHIPPRSEGGYGNLFQRSPSHQNDNNQVSSKLIFGKIKNRADSGIFEFQAYNST